MTAIRKKKVARFSGKNRGVTPSVAAPDVTHPSDATGEVDLLWFTVYFMVNIQLTSRPKSRQYNVIV